MSKRSSRNRKQRHHIEASQGPKNFAIQGASETLEIEAAAEGESSGPKKFAMTAYTGAAMKVSYGWPVVVDLAGIKVPSQTTPIFRNHDPERIVGHTTKVEVTAQRIKVAGLMSGDAEHVGPIVASAANGFPWQASIGAHVDRMEFVDRDETVKVNGRSFTGPVYVARATTLGEISFVPLGADMGTSASVAASKLGEDSMNPFEKWLAAKGFDPAALNDTQKTTLQASFDLEQKPAKVQASVDTDADILARRKAAADEVARASEITRICATYGKPTVTIEVDGEKVECSMEEHAIRNNWTVGETEVKALRAERAKWTDGVGVKRKSSNGPIAGEVIEAALCMSRSLPNIEKQFKPETLEAAHKHFRNLGPQQLILMAAAANGYSVGPGTRISTGNIREVMHAAFSIQASGFSTVPLPGILGNVANKEILSGYMEEDQTWRQIASVKSVSNFQQVTSYRMFDDMVYEKLAPTGEIKHGKLSEESYTRQVDTYAKMFALTRRDIINDDLGAFDDLRNRLGRGAAIKFNDAFWTEFMSDASTFWTAARTNYITGATTNLGTDGVGLGLAVKAFRQMTSPSGDGTKRVGGNPEILLVPPELEQIATALYTAGNSANVKVSDVNTFAGKYRPVVSAWLSDTNVTGNSTKAFYLLRNPSMMPAIVVSFLNGAQAPTVESAEADFNTLGIQFRGYHDFGCDQAEYLAGVKSKGEA